MNPDNVLQLLQKGFRVSLGATTSLVESIQDPQKRDENIAKLSLEWHELAEEWATKGEVTEQEARNLVDNLIAHRNHSSTTASGNAAAYPNAANPSAPPEIQLELQELTAQISAIRVELEKLRNPEAS